jgi:hypothetical protein
MTSHIPRQELAQTCPNFHKLNNLYKLKMGSCCSTEKGQRLGGEQTTEQPRAQTQMADKEAMLKAAEQRLKVCINNKDKEKGGVLAKKLKEQNAIGPGRAGQSSSEATLKVFDIK